MNNEPISIPMTSTDHARQLFGFAYSYKKALLYLIANKDNDLDPVLCFLASHSIELYLKSYAVLLGKDEAWIKKKKHCVAKIFAKCEKIKPLDVPELQSFCENIERANKRGYIYRFPGKVGVMFGEPNSIMQVIEQTDQAIQDRFGDELIKSLIRQLANNRQGQAH